MKDPAKGTRVQANSGVRLVENDGGIDDRVYEAAGGLESTINGNTSTHSSNMTPKANRKTAHETRGPGIPSMPVTPTPSGAAAYQSRRSSSWARDQCMNFPTTNSHGLPADSPK